MNFNLCGSCEKGVAEENLPHDKTHLFIKLRRPVAKGIVLSPDQMRTQLVMSTDQIQAQPLLGQVSWMIITIKLGIKPKPYFLDYCL